MKTYGKTSRTVVAYYSKLSCLGFLLTYLYKVIGLLQCVTIVLPWGGVVGFFANHIKWGFFGNHISRTLFYRVFSVCVVTAPKKSNFTLRAEEQCGLLTNLRPFKYKCVCLPTLIPMYCLKIVYILPSCSLKTQPLKAGCNASISIVTK